MDIKAADVKALREKTGAGMMECKKALVDCGGDEAKAVKLLKEKGLAAVEKRSDRATKEGRVFIKTEGNKTVMVELTCETDFVAKNADFIACGDKIVETVFTKGYTEINAELSDMLLDFATKTRENMALSKVTVLETADNNVFAKYIHSDNKTGVVILLKVDPASAKDNEVLKQFAYDCCLHIAAFTPAYITRDEVDAQYIADQKEIFAKQAESLDKPQNVIDGIIQGKINKHLAEICFMDQMFVKDDKVSVSKKMEAIGKEIGGTVTLDKVVTYILGA